MAASESRGDGGAGRRGDAPARVLLPSLRRVNAHAAWCANYEFEDVARSVDDVDLLELEPAGRFATRQRIARSLAWRGWHPALARLNPGLRPVRLDRDYELLVLVCMNVWDLLSLNAVQGWRERCRTKVCYVGEIYASQVRDHGPLLELLADFDHVALSFSGSVDAVARAVGKPCHHVPLAADVQRFSPYPDPPARVVDVLSVGRRSEPVHEALLRLAAARRIHYVHDTLPSALIRPSRPVEHRDMLARTAMRSRLFVTYPAKFGDQESQGQLEVGGRYFEGAAAGSVFLGQAPTAPSFRDLFPWPDAVVEARADGSDVAEVVEQLTSRPDEIERMSRRNAEVSLRRHDWAHRWQALLRAAGLRPHPALERRLSDLEGIADAVGGPRRGEEPAPA